MSEINFQPVFAYIDQSLFVLKEDVLSLKEDMGLIKTSLAQLSAIVQNLYQEMHVSNHRIDRLEAWAKPAGDKIGLPIIF